MYGLFRDQNGTLYAWETDVFGLPPAFFTIPPATRNLFQSTSGQNFYWNILQGPAPFTIVFPAGQIPAGEFPVVFSRTEEEKLTPLPPKVVPPSPLLTNPNSPFTNHPPIVINPNVFNPIPPAVNPTGINAPHGVILKPGPFQRPLGSISVNSVPPPPVFPFPRQPLPSGGNPNTNSTSPAANAANPNGTPAAAGPSFLRQLSTLLLVTSPAWATLAYLRFWKR